MVSEIAGGIKPQVENVAGGIKPQIIAGDKIPFREIRKEEYMKMLDENKNDNEKIYIREMNEEGYSMMENEMENEMDEMDEMEREFDNDEMYNEEEYMEMDEIGNKILRDPQLERKGYESEKVRYQINNIYRKYGLKINNKKLLSLNKLKELINDMICIIIKMKKMKIYF